MNDVASIDDQLKTIDPDDVADVAIIVTFENGDSQFIAPDDIAFPDAMLDILSDCIEHVKTHGDFTEH